MKRMHQSPQLAELFVKAGLIAALAAVLLLPTTIRTDGSEAVLRGQAPPLLKRATWDGLRLPPIPYLETMPWLTRERTPKGFKIDTLLAPELEMMGPAVARKVSGDSVLSLNRAPAWHRHAAENG